MTEYIGNQPYKKIKNVTNHSNEGKESSKIGKLIMSGKVCCYECGEKNTINEFIEAINKYEFYSKYRDKRTCPACYSADCLYFEDLKINGRLVK